MFNFMKCPNCGNSIDITEEDDTTTTCPKCGANIAFSQTSQDVMSLNLAGMGDLQNIIQNAGQFKHVKELALAGDKIEAIKLYRQLTNVGLKEAKDAVDALEAGQPLVITQSTFSSSNASLDEEELKQKLLELLQDDQKIEAIKLVREKTNMGLKEAKDVVDGLETNPPLAPQVTIAASAPIDTQFESSAQNQAVGSSEPTISENPFDEKPNKSGSRALLLLVAILIIAGLCLTAFFLVSMQ